MIADSEWKRWIAQGNTMEEQLARAYKAFDQACEIINTNKQRTHCCIEALRRIAKNQSCGIGSAIWKSEVAEDALKAIGETLDA